MTAHTLQRRAALMAMLSLATPWPARAQRATAPATPDAPIQALNTALLAAMRAGKATPFEQRFTLLAPAVEAAFDLETLLRGAIGPRWADMAPTDQEALRASFRRFSIASWVAHFDSFSGQSFTIAPTTRDLGNGALAVETRLLTPGGAGVELTYVMRQSAGAWRAVDVLAEGGISRVAVLRSDFRAALNTGGATALVTRLREKTTALGAP